MFKIRKYFPFVIIILYLVFNLITLTRFPLMHSDESWLSGLSRHILTTGDYGVTEPFFDLKPRHPHALKVIFHSLQILIIKVTGYSLFSIRLLALIFGLFTLYHFYRLSRLLLPTKNWAIFACFLLGLDIQFLYASHFGRQEAILLWMLVFGLCFYFRNLPRRFYRHDLILGALAGLSFGIHPNGLIVALVFIALYLYQIGFEKGLKLRSLLFFSSIFALTVLSFIVLSFNFDPNFLTNYLNYGEEQFKILCPFSDRLSRFVSFFQNIFLQKSGTYYIPNLRLQLLLFGSIIPVTLINFLFKPKENQKSARLQLIISLGAVIVGFLVIGRYNPTSIVFLFPLAYLLTASLMAGIFGKLRKAAPAAIFAVLVLITISNIYPFFKYNYYSYLKQIKAVIHPNRKVLASLNTEYCFNDGKLLDLRNLSYLGRNRLTFGEYIRKNRIEYIVFPEGMDFIYRNRPKWNGVYGHLPYYLEMEQFIAEHCKMTARFADPAYGIEIPAYAGKKNWQITIYQVLPEL